MGYMSYINGVRKFHMLESWKATEKVNMKLASCQLDNSETDPTYILSSIIPLSNSKGILLLTTIINYIKIIIIIF